MFELARGGMGVVYAGRTNDGPRQHVAIKLMREAAVEQRKHLDMFLDEMWIASCVRHEHVVEVLDAGEHEGLPFLVMEFVPGLSLLDLLKGGSRPPPDVLHAILAAAARGLHAAHDTAGPDGEALHIVHRDVSPHNVLVGFDGSVKVTDFGVAAARGRRTHTTSGEIKGKVSYMAPEQITREQATDRRADVWALGVIAWESFAGRKLFTGADDAQRMFSVLRHPVPDLTEAAPGVSPSVARVVMQALARDVEQRVPTAEAFASAMDEGSATKAALAAWMRAHHGAQERALEESLREAEGREATAVTSVLVKDVAEVSSPKKIPRERANEETRADPPRAPRGARWRFAPLAVLVGLAAAAFVAVPRLGAHEAFSEPASPGASPTPRAPAVAATDETARPIDEPSAAAPASADVAPTDGTPPDGTPTDTASRRAGRRTGRRTRPAAEAAEPSMAAEAPRTTEAPRGTEAPATPTAEPRAGSRLLDNPFARP